MSMFFNKNRQQAQPRWQKRPTATNSQNDKFTIYAQMQPKLEQSSHNWFLQHNKNRIASSQTPITRSKINKMRETLQNLQMLNDGYGQSRANGQINFNNSNTNSIESSRNRQQQAKQDYCNQQKDNLIRIKQPVIINKKHNNFLCEPYMGSQLNDDLANSQCQNYNQKLQLMRKRLQIISQKQLKQQNELNNQQGQNFIYSIQSPQSSLCFRNQPSKCNSQQSTTRQKDKQKITIVNNHIYSNKNTVPMPTIIHEDQIQQLQIPSTVHLNTHVQHQQGNRSIHVQLKRAGPSPNHKTSITHHNYNNSSTTYNNIYNKNKSIKSMKSTTYNNTLSQKKQQDGTQFYYELYPSMSQQLDMRIYKNSEDQQNRYQITKKDKQQFQNMRNQLQNARNSIWQQPNYINNQSRINQSSQSTKRKISNYSASGQTKPIQNSNNSNNKKIERGERRKSPLIKEQSIKQNTKQTQQYNKMRMENDIQMKKSKIHRASVKQMIFENDQDGVVLYTASTDYSVKLLRFDRYNNMGHSYELYRHRGAVTSLTKIDDILLSTGHDMYLKYYKVHPSGNILPFSQQQYHIQNAGMYKLEECPTQLLGISQNNVMVSSCRSMWLFDIQACTIGRRINKLKQALLLQNGRNIYIGTTDSLSILDLRCADPIVNIYSNLPQITDWIIHPTQPILIGNSHNELMQIDTKYIKQSTLDPCQSIIDYCWSTSDHNRGQHLQPTNRLSLLTQQIKDDSCFQNKILRFNYDQVNRYVDATFNASAQMEVAIHEGTIANAMTILRQHSGIYYTADKMGNLFTMNLNKNEIRNRSKTNNNIDQNMKRSRNQTQYQRKAQRLHAY